MARFLLRVAAEATIEVEAEDEKQAREIFVKAKLARSLPTYIFTDKNIELKSVNEFNYPDGYLYPPKEQE